MVSYVVENVWSRVRIIKKTTASTAAVAISGKFFSHRYSFIFNTPLNQQGDGSGNENIKAKEEQAKAQEEAKHSILAQILDQSARARCSYSNFIFYKCKIIYFELF